MKESTDHKKVWGSGYRAGLKASGEKLLGTEVGYPTAKDVMLCWTPGTDRVRLIPHPDMEGKSSNYEMSTLACNSFVHNLSFEQRKTLVFIEAMHLIARDQVNPEAVHLTLLGLAEYRDGCAHDMPYLYA